MMMRVESVCGKAFYFPLYLHPGHIHTSNHTTLSSTRVCRYTLLHSSSLLVHDSTTSMYVRSMSLTGPAGKAAAMP